MSSRNSIFSVLAAICGLLSVGGEAEHGPLLLPVYRVGLDLTAFDHLFMINVIYFLVRK